MKDVTLEEITAQSFVFFLAAFETSSSTMSWAMYELAKNPHIQQKVRDEINTVVARCGGKLTYEGIQEMKYLSQVVDETLRKYPPGAALNRRCTQDYKVPDHDIIIKQGTRVFIPVLGIHYDEEYYPDPEKFDPERFNEENIRSRPQYAYIPFGEGPRICIDVPWSRSFSSTHRDFCFQCFFSERHPAAVTDDELTVTQIRHYIYYSNVEKKLSNQHLDTTISLDDTSPQTNS
ncbi:probable cytochrome P450 6a13 [Zophobas morio]|uniref:probable cytochrome P450 6a13 n=1 Tax=Zophobas morio TaxID=2755281 RepID=UPI00308324C2